jgi:uncharacterized protein
MLELMMSTAFLAGLMGSGHCLVMCGGIATALAPRRDQPGARTWLPLLYQFGRILGYCAAGALVGALGLAAGAGLGTAWLRWSDVLRLAASLVVILIGLNLAFGGSRSAAWRRWPERIGAGLWRGVFTKLGRQLPQRPVPRALVVGLLWGWMPCGLVYSALLAAAVSGGALPGAATMCAFGLGTLPAMLAFSQAGGWTRKLLGPQRTALSGVFGAVLVACGLWTAAMPLMDLSGHGHRHAGESSGAPMDMPTGMPMDGR